MNCTMMLFIYATYSHHKIEFFRTKCHYNANIKVRIDNGSNRYYLAFVIENVNGYGDIGHVELLPSKPGASWLPMKRSYGVTWSVGIDEKTPPPYSVRITGQENSRSVTANNLIPKGYGNGKFYYSSVNF